MKRGFYHKGQFIKYMDPLGKDIGFERWRISLHYEPNFATTHFEPNEEAYRGFLAYHAPECYPTYGEYRQEAEARRKERVTP